MKHKRALSSSFNMSLGFIPVILSIVLCEFIGQEIALYIGTGVGVVCSYSSLHKSGTRVPHFILYISTAILTSLSLFTFIPITFVPAETLPLTLEAGILIPMLILYLHRKRFINFYLRRKDVCGRRLFGQGAESAVVSAQTILILGGVHFAIICLTIMSTQRVDETTEWILFNLLPPAVFILCILFNQLGLRYFNRVMSHMEYAPIVNVKGDVIGRSLTVEAVNYKNEYINPVIRIAITSNGMLFLCNRSQSNLLDKGKMDTPLECYLRYGETLVEGANRVVQSVFPGIQGLTPLFNVKYHFENSITNRLLYLFIIDLTDNLILCDPRFENGKLWRPQQIEQNLGQNFFCECFEQEYEHLKSVIYTREKYRES